MITWVKILINNVKGEEKFITIMVLNKNKEKISFIQDLV